MTNVGIKPLVWRQNTHSKRWEAKTDVFHYTISFYEDDIAKDEDGKTIYEKGAAKLVKSPHWSTYLRERGIGKIVEIKKTSAEDIKRLVEEYHRRRVMALLS